jgi:hypothetical protein
MAVSLKHTTEAVGTDAGNGEIRKAQWNEEHALTLATARLLGRTTAGAGVVEEISAGTGLTLSSGSLSVTTDTYQPLDSELTALAGLTSAADRLPYFTGSGAAALATFTTAGRNLIDDADAAAQRTTLGVPATSDIVGQQTIWVPAGAMTARTTNGAASGSVETSTNKVMLKTLDFDTTTQEFAQFAIQMPKGWDEGTLVCQFVWSHPSTTTNFGVVWAIAAVAFADDDAADAAFGTEQTATDTGGTTNDVYISPETSAMTVAGSPGAEEWVVFQVKRNVSDGSDNMAVDARLHGVKIHYTTDAAKDD